MRSDRPSLISLFAGAGGLDIGLEMAGFSTLAINELQPHACNTLRENKRLRSLKPQEFDAWFERQTEQRCLAASSANDLLRLKYRLSEAVGTRCYLRNASVVEGDVRQITSDALMEMAGIRRGELTLIAGGPPCQPFSRAGKRETVEAEDGRLFLEFVRIVRDVRPRWFLFENVKGLAQSRTVVPYLVCTGCGAKTGIPFECRASALAGDLPIARCEDCGRNTAAIEILDRKGGSLEIIMDAFEAIGYRCQCRILNAADYGVPQSRERLIIVGSRDGEVFQWPTPTHRCPTDTPLPKRQGDLFAGTSGAGSKPAWVTVKDTLWEDGHPTFGRLDYKEAALWVKNVVRPHAEAVTWSLERPSPTVGAHQAAKLALAPYGVPEKQLARQQWHTLGRRQKDLPPVFVEHNMLSDDELLSLQTFPSSWYLSGTRMERAFQIGNAVPPKLACAIGRALVAACEYDDTREGERTTLSNILAAETVAA
jgi:DNA (cytosine-5)-methyltransferase 1